MAEHCHSETREQIPGAPQDVFSNPIPSASETLIKAKRMTRGLNCNVLLLLSMSKYKLWGHFLLHPLEAAQKIRRVGWGTNKAQIYLLQELVWSLA